MSTSANVKAWRKATKERMIEAMGGKCQCCGYNRCNEALDFHHLDPSQKEMPLGSIRANPRAWPVIVNELKKCVLVCRNCHGELHYGVRQLPEVFAKFDERYMEYKTHPELCDECPECHKLKPKYRRFCSPSCSATHRVDWSKYDLVLLANKHTAREIAEMVGCSSAAVGRKLREYGVLAVQLDQRAKRSVTPFIYEKEKKPKKSREKVSDIDPDWRHNPNGANRKVEWPTKDVLEKLVWEKPITEIGKDYGVRDNTVRKWCKRYGIECPRVGYWQRRASGYSHEESLISQKRITKPKRLITRDIAERAAALRLKGQSYRDIGIALGFGHWSIQSALRRYGFEGGCSAPARTEDIRVTT